MARDSRELADALREQPPILDDVARARLEKAILHEPRTTVVRSRPRSRHPFVAGVGAGLAVAALALLGWLTLAPTSIDHEVASFETFAGSSAHADARRSMREGSITEGEVVTTPDDQHVRAHFAERRVEVELAPSSRARFLRLGGSDLAVGLDRGSVRVSFHPERRGERTLAIETPLARVEVVGTVFEVDVDADGTRVRVEEGIVRVVPREGDERFVHAGESVRVRQTRTAQTEPSTQDELVELRAHEATDDGTFAPIGTDSSPVEAWARVARGSAGTRTIVEPWIGASSDGVRELEVSGIEVSPTTNDPTLDGTMGSEAGDDPSLDSVGSADPAGVAPASGAQRAEAATELAAPRGRSGRALPEDARFEIAMRHLDADRFDAARHELHAIARTSSVRAHRARAWADIALTYARQGDTRQATEAYRRAAQTGRGTEAGANALFALGQMRLRLGEDELARAAFREYVQVAPDGPLADRARRTLCQRLGVWEECGE